MPMLLICTKPQIWQLKKLLLTNLLKQIRDNEDRTSKYEYNIVVSLCIIAKNSSFPNILQSERIEHEAL